MLTSITLKDYTTFINKRTFDFKATNYKILEDTNVNKNRILKGSLFVGENASGKTQVLESLLLLLNILFENREQNYASKKSLYTKGNKYSVKYGFSIDNNDINYEIIFKDNSIYSEKLFINDLLKIERIGSSGTSYFNSEVLIDDINTQLSILKLVYYNTKFYNDPILNKWFDFLKNSIYVYSPSRRIKGFNPEKEAEQYIHKYAEKKDATPLNNVISKLKYNSEIVFDKSIPTDGNDFLNEELVIRLKKTGTDISIPMYRESIGNRAFVKLLLPIIFATKNDCMIIIDEFSSGLHNELEEALIRFFYNNSKNSQMFFTSHSTNLIDTAILRPDQIYSFSFNAKDGTCIKRFSDENPRESQNMEKMYLNGVFDGMPEYDKEFKNK